jgi:ABC-type multidrug transport system ATPase subunit
MNSRSRSRPASTWAKSSSIPRTLSKSYGDRLLIDDLTFRLPAGGIVGVIGPNGAGKTTLFRMITGQEQPDSGTIALVILWS